MHPRKTRISITAEASRSVNNLGFEVVERKGIGHPDSLADLVAEEFCQRYARYGLEQFEVVPNHWVDKIALVGAAAEIEFGSYHITKPISAYLFGKVTQAVVVRYSRSRTSSAKLCVMC